MICADVCFSTDAMFLQTRMRLQPDYIVGRRLFWFVMCRLCIQADMKQFDRMYTIEYGHVCCSRPCSTHLSMAFVWQQGKFFDAVVKVYCIHTEPNYSLPWQRKRQYSSTSSGFMVKNEEGQRCLLTNAHSVEYHTQVYYTWLRKTSAKSTAVKGIHFADYVIPTCVLAAVSSSPSHTGLVWLSQFARR